MKRGHHGYFVKRTRHYSTTNIVNNITFFIKSIIFSGLIFLIFTFSINLIIKYFVNTIDIKIPKISLFEFNTPKFIIIENKNFYALYGNGEIKLIESNIDNYNLPIISGVSTKEENEQKSGLIKQILKINKKFLVDVSEINIKNPDKIIIFTNEGKKIFLGKQITNEKLENYSLVKDRLKNINIKYKYVDLPDEERVIIKKEGK